MKSITQSINESPDIFSSKHEVWTNMTPTRWRSYMRTNFTKEWDVYDVAEEYREGYDVVFEKSGSSKTTPRGLPVVVYDKKAKKLLIDLSGITIKE